MITLAQARKRYEHDPEAARRAAEAKEEARRRHEQREAKKKAREDEALAEFEGALTQRKIQGGTKLASKLKKRRQERQSSGQQKYEITDGGQDAILHFGRHSGKRLSELAETKEGRGYLSWMCDQKFPSELLKLAEEWHR